ncbi:S1 RNA-binding domain-containing protein, partial [bacterium]|nr:S1 RNA-binding domain-containing protein [bacterium]
LEGIVKNVTDYGVFVDLGGFDGLVHITDMTWGRISHPSEMYSVGDDIRVVVTKIDSDSGRVSLGLKQLEDDPWEGIEQKFPVGSRVAGKVVNVTDYGAFIELELGIEGLVHVSEMSWTKKVRHPSKMINLNDAVDAIVLDVDRENRRISLGIKQLEPNPWDKLDEKFPIGSQVHGTIKNIADFGIFVDVGGDVDGLIHISDISWIQNFTHPSDIFAKGQEIDALVLNIDSEQERFSLGIKQLHDDPWSRIMDIYKKGDEVSGKVIKATQTAALVELEEDIVGLLPAKDVRGELREGEEVTAKISVLNHRESKLMLSME